MRLLSCCKLPVKTLIKVACKYSSSCYGKPPGFLQNDRQVVDKSEAFHHSVCLLLIMRLLSCCKHLVKILIKAACKYSSSCYGKPPGFLQNDRQVVDKSQAFHHSICLLLITHLLSCCKHPVKILIKASCKYSSSCYGKPPGFLQNDRQVVDKSEAFHHSVCLLLIMRLLSCCKHLVKILIKAACKYSSSCYGKPPGFLQNDRQVVDRLPAFHHSICLPLITHSLSCCKHSVKTFINACYHYPGFLEMVYHAQAQCPILISG